jgi:hypothetical protein
VLRRLPLVPVFLTLGLLAARILRGPALMDPRGDDLPSSVRLSYPILHLFFSPLFDMWDGVSLLSMSRLEGFLAGLALAFLCWRLARAWLRRKMDPDAGPPIGLVREIGVLGLALVMLLLFVAGGMLWHRPMVALSGVPAGMAAVDFHSHTTASHDVEGLMEGYDAESNRRWHARAGFDAAFITDHNTVDGFPAEWSHVGSTLLCPGIEVSGWRAHIVLLGATEAVDRTPYTDSLAGVLQLLRESRARGLVAIASLPEYDRNHWENLALFVSAGVSGFEIVNASPKANEFSQARRDSIIALAGTNDLLLLAVTDSHGWGATVLAWNLVRIPGWNPASPGACDRLIGSLQAGGTESVQIAERHHLRAESWWPWLLTPVGVVWESWRALTLLQAVSWLAWIWLAGTVRAYRRN